MALDASDLRGAADQPPAPDPLAAAHISGTVARRRRSWVRYPDLGIVRR